MEVQHDYYNKSSTVFQSCRSYFQIQADTTATAVVPREDTTLKRERERERERERREREKRRGEKRRGEERREERREERGEKREKRREEKKREEKKQNPCYKKHMDFCSGIYCKENINAS